MPRARRAVIFALLATAFVACLSAPSVAWGRPGTSDPFDVAKTVAEVNLIDPLSGWIRPSPAYSGSWMRDSFWTTGILGSDVGRRSLAHFGARLTPSGQAPTKIEAPSGPAYYYDDESTIIYLIWSYRDNGQPNERLVQAWKWISKRVDENGWYWTPGGTFHTWHDILLFPEKDVASYNQGLYAVAAQAALRLGIAKPADAEMAARAYRRLYRPQTGYLPVSLRMDYRDASALAGEFLARTMLGVSFLDNNEVVSTVRGLPRSGPGFLTLSKADGSYLDPLAFFIPMAPGQYQNGGSWLLYDAMAWSTAWMAGADEAKDMAMRRLTAEADEGTLYEYLPTGPSAWSAPTREDYGWNSYAWFAVGTSQDSTRPFPSSIVRAPALLR